MIFWVIGGTAVGKKRFIRACVDPATRPAFIVSRKLAPVWIQDGPCEVDIEAAAAHRDLMIRWQWGREEAIHDLMKRTSLRHTLIVLTTGLVAQLSRIAVREGALKWDAENIHGELRNIYEMVHRLTIGRQVPVLYVDSTTLDYQVRQSL